MGGTPATDEAAIRKFVDGAYPGVTVASPTGGAPERVITRTSAGRTVVRRADGTEYTRAPQKGDSYYGDEIRKAKRGRPVDMAKLQC